MSTTTRQKELFLAARDLPDPAERARFLDDGCGGDAALRTRVEQMLAADAAPDHFLEQPIAPPPEMPSPVAGDKIGYFGDYVLLDEIARGASGIVFRARQVSLDRVVALKMLRDRCVFATEADTHRLRAEAAAAAALDHPHIVPIHEVGVHEGQPYFSMKLIEGGTLQWRMAEFQADARLAAALMAKVARAVHHAHTRGVLHRDLKPGNILVDAAGEPHITDFGLARKIGEVSQLSITGQIVGTPHYMAPEQVRGAGRELTPGADIYSMGAMLYELLEARHAFASDDLLALLKLVAESPPPPLRRAPADLAAIVLQCIAKQPAHRYGTAAALADDLDRWLRGEPVQAMRYLRLRRVLFLLRRHRWKIAAAAAAITAGGAFVWFNTRPGTKPPPPVITITTLTDELDAPGTGLSLREALRDAPEGARLIIAPALLTPDATLTLSGALGGMEISRSVTLDGAGLTIQSGAHTDRIFVIAGEAHASFHNLTLSGSVQSDTRPASVGGIESNGTLSMTDCRILNNGGAGFGGGISSNGDVNLLRCTFSGNVSNGVGGALCIRGPISKVRVEHCVFTGNQSHGNGGGGLCITIKSRDAHVQLTHCTITGNASTASPTRTERPRRGEAGGGIRIQSGTLVLSHCIVAGNESTVPGTENISGSYSESGPNFIGGDPKHAPAGMGAQLPEGAR